MTTQHNPTAGRGLQTVAVMGVVIAAPLVGLGLTRQSLAGALQWPPQPRVVDMPGFEPWVFAAALVAVAATLGPAVYQVLRTRSGEARRAPGRFPAWGWLGVALLAAAWAVSWGAVPTPRVVQQHSFTALWFGYIVSVQAVTHWRAGDCLLTRSPWRLLALFPASAVFWWMFEYLNQFVGNWRYTGSDLDGWAYFAAATLPFATVIPAVVSTRDLLATIPRLQRAFNGVLALPFAASTGSALLALAVGTATLAALPLAPMWLFPFVWLSPTAILLAVQWFAGERHLLSALARGDWRGVELSAAAGLVCGLFWELWNWASLARWTYAIPYVDAVHVFEMPLLGYAGYLPFGVFCIAAATLVVDTPSVAGPGGAPPRD